MSFTYTTGIPAAGNNPSVDQPNMQTNTNSINSLIAVDPFTFASGDAGAHNRVQLKEISTVVPAGLKGNGFETLYAKVAGSAPLGPLGELFYVRGNGVTGIQLTGPGTPTLAVGGYTFLPGGIMFQWGLQAGSSASTVPVSFSPVFSNACFNVSAIPVRAASSPGSDFSTAIVTGSVTTSGFSIANIGGHAMAGWYWQAIGN